VIETPPDVAALLAKGQIPFGRARRKLADVLSRLAAGEPPLDCIREVWCFGSFARGAPLVGDVDLYMLVDEPRPREQFSLDAYYSRGRPYSQQIKALGCGGSSFVSIQGSPVFGAPGEPASPELLAAMKARGEAQGKRLPALPPVIRHLVTNEPLAGPFILLWARGDEPGWAQGRLAAIREDPDAERFERTTTVPLLDDLVPRIGLDTAFMLAVQVRQRNLRCRAFVLAPAEPPQRTVRILRRRYRPAGGVPSTRELVAGSVLARLDREGVDLRRVELIDHPVVADRRRAEVSVGFNPFRLYQAASGAYRSGTRVVQLWATSARGPWLGVEATIIDSDAARDLYFQLIWDSGSKADRAHAITTALERAGPGQRVS
jgi:hypothetical protein